MTITVPAGAYGTVRATEAARKKFKAPVVVDGLTDQSDGYYTYAVRLARTPLIPCEVYDCPTGTLTTAMHFPTEYERKPLLLCDKHATFYKGIAGSHMRFSLVDEGAAS
jgi:hypothetical protein